MKPLHFFVQFFIVVAIAACSHHKEEHADASKHNWPEMDAFHMTMAESFHPFKDSSNLAPAKKNAEQLATEAAQWASSPLPENLNNDAGRAALQKLKTDCRSFADLVAAGATADPDLGTKLSDLHTQFHTLMESFHGESHEAGDK